MNLRYATPRLPSRPSSLTLAAIALASLALPARATGFLDLSTWSGATPCSESVTASCVAQPGEGHDYDVAGTDSDPGTYVITSASTSQPVYVGFSSSFEPANSSLSTAQYSTDGSLFIDLPIGVNVSSGPILVAAGQSFSFRLLNSGEQPILGISDFSSTPVPAPLPFLGAAASFGWIRARRAVLRARQQK